VGAYVSPALNEIEEPSSAMLDEGSSSNGGGRVTVPKLFISVVFFSVTT